MTIRNRWIALTLISLTFVSQTIVWYSIVPLFPSMREELGLSLIQTGAIFSSFMLGFSLLHIPSGFFCQRYGIRAGLYVGMGLEVCTAAITAFSHNYSSLLAIRFVCGISSSLFDGAAIAFVAGWFRNRGGELPIANGCTTGIAYALGSSSGLYLWGVMNKAIGWRAATLVAASTALITLIVFVVCYPLSPGERSEALKAKQRSQSSFTSALASARTVLGNGRLWLVSIAMFGIYGSALAAAAMLPQYAETYLGVDADRGNALGAILLLFGMLGTFFGAFLLRKIGSKGAFLTSGAILACAIVLIPFSEYSQIEIEAAVIGCMLFSAYTVWISIPGFMVRQLGLSDVATAVGLMMSVAALGPVGLPVFYGELSEAVKPEAGWIGLAVVALGFSTMILWAEPESRRPMSVP